MKKSTCIVMACILMSSFGLFAKNDRHHQITPDVSRFPSTAQGHLISFAPFYSEDFSGGIPAGWQNIDSSGNGLLWNATSQGASNGDSLSVVGTSATNGYVIIDSDSAGGVNGENADLITDAIDCSGHPTVVLNFNEYLIFYNDTATVQVSTDGTNWTVVYSTSPLAQQFNSTPNPHNVDVDISSIAANQATVYIRFNYKADYSYYWMIDDIQLYELSTANAAVTEIVGPATSCIVLSGNETVTVTVYNAGSTPISGFDLAYVADGGSPVTENVSATVNPGASLPYSFTATADFSNPGPHTMQAYVTLTGDTINSNDTITTSIFNGPHIVNTSNLYTNGFEATDDVSGFLTEDGNNDNNTWQVSTLFPRTGAYAANLSSAQADDWYFTTCLDFDDAINYNLKFYYRTNSTATQADFEVLMGLSQASGDMTIQLVPLARISNVFYLPSSTPFTVPASGTYYIGFHVMNGDSIAGINVDDIVVEPTTGVGIQNIAGEGFAFFPNPSTGIIYLNSKNAESKNYFIEVINPVGQLISSMETNELQNFPLDLSEKADGIYFVRIHTDSGVTTHQVSKTH